MALAKRPPAPVPEAREPSQQDEKPRPQRLEPEPGPSDEDAAAPPPSEEQRRRWLERVRDDPTHALRAAARAQRRASPRRGALAW